MNHPFEGVSEEMRQMMPPGLSDVGGGKAVLEIDEKMVEACRNARAYCADTMERAKALAQNIKDNGSSFEETWAGFMALSENLDFANQGAPVMLAYLLTAQVYPEENA